MIKKIWDKVMNREVISYLIFGNTGNGENTGVGENAGINGNAAALPKKDELGGLCGHGKGSYRLPHSDSGGMGCICLVCVYCE